MIGPTFAHGQPPKNALMCLCGHAKGSHKKRSWRDQAGAHTAYDGPCADTRCAGCQGYEAAA